MNKIFFVVLLSGFAACKPGPSHPENPDPNAPKGLSYSILGTFPHDTSSYTQGLVMYKGELYESTGLEGRSKLMKVDLKTGKAVQPINLEPKYFGEGVTILNDTLYQLTWKNKVVLAYTLKDLKKIKEIPLDIVGWGLTHDGKNLIVSTGGSDLNFYEPFTFKLLKSITVTESGMPTAEINELEYINGFVYANQYLTPYILKIDPATGQIVAKVDITNTWDGIKSMMPGFDEGNIVPNGIAYDAGTKKIYITGKWWPKLYEIQFSH